MTIQELLHALLGPSAHMLGISSTTLLAMLLLGAKCAELVGKAIPDSATGVPGAIRQLCKVVGMYIPNNAGNAGEPPKA